MKPSIKPSKSIGKIDRLSQGTSYDSNSSQAPYAIKVEDLTVSYNHKIALWDIDLEIPEGVMMAIVGPNGAGKSTFIKAFLNLIPKASGKSFVLGRPYEDKEVKQKVGYVPQTNSIDLGFSHQRV